MSASAIRLHAAAPTALVTGVCGQDGALLAAHLSGLGYRVVGTSRDAARCDRQRLEAVGVARAVAVESLDLADAAAVRDLIARVAPDEIYHLAGESSVAASYREPAAAFTSVALGTLNVLEALRVAGAPTRLFVAGSVAMFGDTGGVPLLEESPVRPADPYGLAKATAASLVAQYRGLHGLHACTGILANHESPLRGERFVTQKVVRAACRIAAGDGAPLVLGDLAVERDWGWAEEYVAAMHAMLRQDVPEDLVIATGTTVSLEAFVAEVFARVGLDWRRHVVRDQGLIRAGEPRVQAVDPRRAAARLGWRATVTAPEVARRLVDAALAGAGPARRAA